MTKDKKNQKENQEKQKMMKLIKYKQKEVERELGEIEK